MFTKKPKYKYIVGYGVNGSEVPCTCWTEACRWMKYFVRDGYANVTVRKA
ncbi:hypothetical protein PLUTO_00450 [Luteibacter phage vB_LflM-Pluto]|uniref:Uncharacterized protein n=1 Tax=Luteibacter phage vB_LflM-Pluto TaxID=2948611 RepID=A0A9E7SLY8_9CAUD|nr:hypothetical protein PLUTO_00450 [Luteibacter phage vB_LflM-Pluto]